MNLIEAAKCIKIRCPVLGTSLEGARFVTREYAYIDKLTVTQGIHGRLIYSAVLADVLAPSGEPKSTVALRIDNVRVSPYSR